MGKSRAGLPGNGSAKGWAWRNKELGCRLVWLDQVRGSGVPGGGGDQEWRVPEGTHPWQMQPGGSKPLKTWPFCWRKWVLGDGEILRTH